MRFHGGRSIIKRDEPDKPPMKVRHALFRLFKHIRRYKFTVGLAFVTMMISAFLHALPPQVIRLLNVFDSPEVTKQLTMEFVITLGVAFLSLHLLSIVVGYANSLASAEAGQSIIRDIRRQVFRHLQKLSLKYYDNQQTGELMSRVLSDVDRLEWGVLDSFMQIMNNIMMFGWQLVLMMYISPRLTFVALSVIPLMVLTAIIYNSRAHEVFKNLREKMADVTVTVQENISGIRVVKAFGREDHECERFDRETQNYFGLSIQAARMMAKIGVATRTLAILAASIILAFGGWLVIQGPLRVGDLVAMIMYVGMLYGPIQSLVHANYHMQRAGVAAQRVFDILDTEPDIQDAPDALPLPPTLAGHVAFDGVSFSYNGGNSVLENISVEARPGEMVAFVGRSGSGKTTLINLIPRMYDVQAGRVCIDGIDVRRLRGLDLRQNIAVVMQDVFLFNGTIRENIAYGRLDATDEDIIRAAEAAHVDEFVDQLPKRYDTQIGERGVRLSGGQRQRIAIARAFLANTRILLLDEPTSNVDTHSERLIQEALERLMEQRTTFVVAHRLSTILNADKIVLLNRGRIEAIGRHHELMQTSKLYAHLYEVQLDEKKREGLMQDADVNGEQMA